MNQLRDYRIVCTDFEFFAPDGENPLPISMVGTEYHSQRQEQLWLYPSSDSTIPNCPFDLGPNTIYVCYNAVAELSCHKALGWPMPTNVLDLMAEFKLLTAGTPKSMHPHGRGLLGAMIHYGLDPLDAIDKAECQQLCRQGGPYSEAKQARILNYNERDVRALLLLLPAMMPDIDLPRALVRGQYQKAVTNIEYAGIPIDVSHLERLKTHWSAIQAALVRDVDPDGLIYDGLTFRLKRFAQWLLQQDIPWPRTKFGRPEVSDDTFKRMAEIYPQVEPIRQTRRCLSQLRLHEIAIGSDGRNRTSLMPFQSQTGRNQPSNSKYIFGMAAWLRGEIKPEPETAVAYCDYAGQEFGVAGALSGDENMQAAYSSGDPYLAMGRQTGAIPPIGTAATHPAQRSLYKQLILSVQYGAGVQGTAQRLKCTPAVARMLLEQHRQLYNKYWNWSDAVVEHAMLTGYITLAMGWRSQIPARNVNPRSIRNLPIQGTGAEIMRLVCIAATETGIRIIAPVHDGFLIESPLGRIENDVAAMKEIMVAAGEFILSGFKLRVDSRITRYPDRFHEKKGFEFWEKIERLLLQVEANPSSQPVPYRESENELEEEKSAQIDIPVQSFCI